MGNKEDSQTNENPHIANEEDPEATSQAVFDPKDMLDPLLKLHLKLEQEGYNNPYVPWEHHRAKLVLEYQEASKLYFDRLVKGVHILKEALNDDEILIELNEILSKSANQQALPTPRQAIIDKLYETATSIYEQKRYEEGSNLLFFLTEIYPLYSSIWVLFGLCEQMLGNVTQAIAAFYQATLLDRSMPHPFLYLAQCFQTLGEKDPALHYTSLILNMPDWKEDYPSIFSHAEKLKHQL